MALPVPDAALADILRRLPPRSLAAARCVCKPWRDLPPPPPPKQKAKAITAPPFCLDSLLASLDGACWTMEEVEPPPPPSPPASSMGDADLYRLMEWPPSPYKVYVFSSRSGRWEERAFVREGGETAATTTTVDDMEPWECPLEGPRQGYTGKFIASRSRLGPSFSLSNDKYQVISTPKIIGSSNFEKPYLGKSKMGVSFGFIQDLQLSIWIIKESAGQMEWILNYQHDLRAVASQVHSIDFWGDQINGPWILEEDNADMHVNTETLSDKDLEWDSDNDDFLATEVCDEGHDYAHLDMPTTSSNLSIANLIANSYNSCLLYY
uniref:F-box domain-containing protein n=1 Tax=Oryza barthii TaxID=65489 RepID=A0A0D3GIQ2_9ORYZ